MRLKVFNNFIRRAWLEADTIETLKASIMDRFSLTADHLSQQRLLVRDNRDLYVDRGPITGCVDLLQLAEGTTLGGDLCKDGDSLRLGWKGPCSILLESGYTKDHKFKVDDSFTLRKLKDEIERLLGARVEEDNLPEVLFNGEDDKPLLFFGYYLFCEDSSDDVPFEIYCNKDNISVVHGPISRVVLYPTPQYNDCGDSADEMENLQVMTWDKDGNERLIPSKEFFIMEEPLKYTKNNNKPRKLQLKENTENQKKRKKNNSSKLKENTENQKKKQKKKINNNKARIIRGMEGDKEEASSYVVGKESEPFNKERSNIEKKKNKKTMKHEDIM